MSCDGEKIAFIICEHVRRARALPCRDQDTSIVMRSFWCFEIELSSISWFGKAEVHDATILAMY